ncbi:MAG: glucoamylase family protein, partial [Novosphingobium sp.]
MTGNAVDDPIGAAAKEVAARHILSSLTVKPSHLPAWEALPEAKNWLTRALSAASVAEPQNASAAEWLLDNDFHVQRAILQVQEDLPPQFYGRLPGIAGDETAGLPRTYFLAHELLHATHLQISVNSAIHFIERYQDNSPLSIAELWAFPTMLRLACMELLVTGFTRLFTSIPSPFKVGPGARISATADDTECVSRAIANLVVISSIQWKDFFDRTNRVEAILQLDPAGIYPRMDFETRDRYRGMVEWLADHSALAEWDVAERLLDHCHEYRELPADHVGYWLIGPGQPEFERAIDVRPPATETIRRLLRRHPRAIYVSGLCLTGLAALLLPLLYLATVGATLPQWLLAIVLLALPASLLSVSLINWLVTLTVSPQTLPKLDFTKAIADDCPTAVVMPVLVGRIGEVSELLQRLEGHFLANRDPLLRFVLLSDHADADSEILADDHLLEQALVDGVNRLNNRHGRAGSRSFFLLHRRRLHNPQQGIWMCWERKRGKLEQFNAFALRGDLGPFPVLAGEVEKLRGVRFVVTADADTRLPPGVVSRMIGALAHPLNKARFDSHTGKVLAGYTILQPRVEIYPETMGRSLFTRFFGGDTTIDIYSRAVSDVYQDLTGTGVFVGKGIYELDAFERSLEGRIPENSLLSHDLFEGLHGRAALASDIIVYEGFPSGYLDYARRWHRWVRGDWQLLPWLFPKVRGRRGERLPNRLSWFGRLKIFDNLRRSLIPASLLTLLLGGWSILPGSPLVWTLFAAAVTAVHLFTDVITGLVRNRHSGVLRELIHRLSDHFGRWSLAMIFLVNDAWVAATAIVVTLWRLMTGRKLLVWTSAAHVSAQFASLDPRRAAWRHMWVSPAIALAIGLVLALIRPGILPVAAPLLLLWLIAPEVAIWINRPLGVPAERLNQKDIRFLRGIARRTWLFFETFVRPEDNWLPPDNYQEPPDEAIAHRTSPTNVGMLMLSILTAWKLGYIGAAELEIRLRQTLDTLDRLEKHRGHMLNWYDTRTLESLEPRYVSTVDSGNLAVSLVVVQQACLEAARGPTVAARLWEGLTDALDQLARALETNSLDPEHKCSALVAAMGERVASGKRDVSGWTAVLDQMHGHDVPGLQERLHQLVAQRENISAALLRDVQVWTERVDHHLLTMGRDLDRFMPWLRLIAQPPAGCADRAAALGQTLGAVVDGLTPDLEAAFRRARELLDTEDGAPAADEARQWTSDLLVALEQSAEAHRQLHVQLAAIAERAGAWAHGMQFGMLFDESSRLFHIGYNISDERIDTHHYDLLASEARLASFFAISKGDVPPEHWFFLGRPITKDGLGLSLVSWNGSMFEYLMPNLFLRSEPETLLGQSDRTAVDLQHDYGRVRKIPWGISESAYASMGADRAYRYHAFGVPDLGLRRGLSRDLVVAPYATSLALAARPRLALRNMRDMADLALIGRYGYYEAADFTPERVPEGQRFVPVRSYMAHHHGMSLAAMGNALCDDMFVDWFHADAHVRTIDLLLNERIPWSLPPKIERVEVREALPATAGTIPRLHPWTPAPSSGPMPMHVIGNGRMTARLATNGAGQLSWHRHTLIGTAAASACAGQWIYVRDRASGELWSVTPEPARTAGSDVHAVFHGHQVEYHRRDHEIAISMTVGIPHGDDLEIRRVAIVNESSQARTLDLTSYGEVILAPGNDAARHPVFSKMFVNSELLPGMHGLLFTRRPRGPEERPPVLLHRLIADDEGIVWRGAEADRAAFLGRHGHADQPAAMRKMDLGNSAGWTLDPIMALRGEIEVPPHGRREIAFVTIAAGSRESAMEIADRYATLASLEWALNDAVAPTAREMHQIGLLPGQLPDAQMLMSRLLQPCSTGPVLRDVFPTGHYGRHDLWAIGISGDYPL